MMIDTSEEIVSSGIVRGGIVFCYLVTIVDNQIRPAGQAKLNPSHQTYYRPGPELSDRHLSLRRLYLTRSNVKFVTVLDRGSHR